MHCTTLPEYTTNRDAGAALSAHTHTAERGRAEAGQGRGAEGWGGWGKTDWLRTRGQGLSGGTSLALFKPLAASSLQSSDASTVSTLNSTLRCYAAEDRFPTFSFWRDAQSGKPIRVERIVSLRARGCSGLVGARARLRVRLVRRSRRLFSILAALWLGVSPQPSEKLSENARPRLIAHAEATSLTYDLVPRSLNFN